MAVELGSAFISVGLSTKGLGGDIKKAFSGVDSEGSSAGKRAGGGFKAGFVGMIAGAVGALGIGTFLKGAVSEASGLGESINAVNVVFGKASKGVQQLGKESAKSLGLSNLEFNNLAVRFSSFAGSIAGPGGDVTGTLKAMTGRAADFASVMNLEVADAAQLFQSGLAGESEPLRQYGIDLSAAAVEAFALKEGITKSAGSMTEAEKVQARYGLLMEKTSVTAGDFANTSNSLANQQRILSSSWKNAQATLGTALLPAISAVTGALIKGLDPAVAGTQKVMSEATGGFRALVAAFKAGGNDITSSGFAGVMERIGLVARSAFDGIRPVVTALAASFAPLIPQVLSLAAALSPTSLLFQALLPVLPQIAAAIGAVIAGVLPLVLSLTSQLIPVISSLVTAILPPLTAIFGDIVLAIVPLVAILLAALIPAIEALLPVVVTVFRFVAELIKNVMQAVQGTIQVVTGVITGDWAKVWAGIGNIFGAVWKNIQTILSGAVAIVGSLITMGMSNASRIVGGALQGIGRFFSDTWNNIVNGVSGMIGRVTGFFSGMGGKIMGALSGAGSWLVGVGQNIVQGLIDGARGMIDRAVAAVRDVGGAMLDGIKGFLGIKSPSRVFKAEVGMMIGAGLIQGLDASQRGVASSVNRLVPIPSVPAYRAGAYTAAGAVTGGSGGPQITINQVDDPIGTAHAVARRLGSFAV